ncbi:2-phosphosulfolactate phosphatase [Microbacterium lemovicicum]|uniref:Probable 2-phosphosulfolactate phosphatase n=1 Tax=Microbacterium lemovicicum TaxID=1072463 RepID=A0A3Q9IWQ5_9MICO|nr:2-phosphosulfolactate phosphatase [Microbacterium lemovicicum]AZS35812.1 2-phosphosulfolactate phosphatase [Microbacterium lemovicicum]
MPQPFDQSRYQIRFEWGTDGFDRLAPADIVVVIDVLMFSTAMTDAAARGIPVGVDDGAVTGSANGAPVAARAAESDALVLIGCLRNASAVAEAILAEQRRRGARTSVALIAAGERDPAGVRFAIEDLLGAGAIGDALSVRGVDHTSPEAAAAIEAFRGLRGALRHLLTAGGTGQRLIAKGERERVLTATTLDDLDVVPVRTDEGFRALQPGAADV